MQAYTRVLFKLPRKRWAFAVTAVAALAIGAPIAWATFTDVPPSNPFYDDINAIQGAGITQGCGGGNFCPTDDITRQAEAAFVHRAAPRTSQSTAINDFSISYSTDLPTDTVVGFTGIDIGGVSGGTQFLTVQVYMTLWYGAGSRPTDVGYYLSDGSCSGPRSNIYFVTIPNSAPSNTSASIGWTEAVDTGTTHVAGLCAFTNGSADHVANVGSFTIQATTSPFGSGGGDTLSPQSASFGGAAATPSGPSQPSGRRAP